jgi:hypothetical protein
MVDAITTGELAGVMSRVADCSGSNPAEATSGAVDEVVGGVGDVLPVGSTDMGPSEEGAATSVAAPGAGIGDAVAAGSSDVAAASSTAAAGAVSAAMGAGTASSGSVVVGDADDSVDTDDTCDTCDTGADSVDSTTVAGVGIGVCVAGAAVGAGVGAAGATVATASMRMRPAITSAAALSSEAGVIGLFTATV